MFNTHEAVSETTLKDIREVTNDDDGVFVDDIEE
jgi:hypothetical protein